MANGPSTSTQLNGLCGMALTLDGGTLYFADYKNHVIRKVVHGYISTVAGVIGSEMELCTLQTMVIIRLE